MDLVFYTSFMPPCARFLADICVFPCTCFRQKCLKTLVVSGFYVVLASPNSIYVINEPGKLVNSIVFESSLSVGDVSCPYCDVNTRFSRIMLLMRYSSFQPPSSEKTKKACHRRGNHG